MTLSPPRRPAGIAVAILVSLALLTASGLLPAAADEAIYAELLGRHVRDGRVDYAGFKADEERLDRYLDHLARIDPEALPRDEQFAYYINAYNAWTIKLILGAYPGVRSIKELGGLFASPWKKKLVRTRGALLSLDEIEHGILRPRFKDPRVHFAINCASKSCPPLLPEPYRGAALEEQLERVTREFLNAPGNVRFDGRRLTVSAIFKWFAEDFGHDPVGFIRRYAEGGLRERLAAAEGRIAVDYFDYDWSLNGV